MNKRTFLKTIIGSAVVPMETAVSETTTNEPESDKGWISIYVHSGESVGSAISRAETIAKLKNLEVCFTFNYCDHFRVKPSGKWTCRRDDGTMPVHGPDSEFVPKEGWSKFFGH